jgi:tetratricopeptide (TPR) repeat protein
VGNGSFRDIDFASEENPRKDKARFMIGMLSALNNDVLPQLAGRQDPPVEMTCKTCHRGQATPRLLSQELLLVAHESGAEAAVARYRELRAEFEIAGAFDFREVETNEVSGDLAAEGRIEEAIAILQLNAEYYPESAMVQAGLGDLFVARGDTAAALGAYERGLELEPGNRQIQNRLSRLRE